jgi:hypothetical protein
MAATHHNDIEVLPGHIRVRTGPELARKLSECGPWRKGGSGAFVTAVSTFSSRSD